MEWIGVPAPIGVLGVAAAGGGICAVRFDGPPRGSPGLPTAPTSPPGQPDLRAAAEQLTAYFAGELTGFDLPLLMRGGSEFDRAVWHAIADIPYGETRTYGQVAAVVGEPDAARAVGVACNRNPLPILVGCHRVIGAGGKLVGFGGGLHRKRHLLELEARVRIESAFG
ncbi:MAG: methylated-DNA--[protein]-cysteine S-methyltransferase [Micromonosporaceae bacterium]|nr:methylated-DNA--[protein]-cysteine S-methyltransferase [Micromonosporaceae bacterium]